MLVNQLPADKRLAGLARYVHVHTAGKYRNAPLRCIPDEHIEIRFDFSSPGKIPVLSGLKHKAVSYPLNAPLDLMRILFDPGAFSALFGLPASRFTDKTVRLDQAIGKESAAAFTAVFDARSIDARVRAMDAALISFAAKSKPVSPLLRRLFALIRKEKGLVTVGRMCAVTGWTRYGLCHRFTSEVGISPRYFCGQVQFVHALRALVERGLTPLQTALLAGYYDQPHFTRKFTELVGISPARFLRGGKPRKTHIRTRRS